VVRNYQNAIKQVGGEVLWESNRETTLKLVKKGHRVLEPGQRVRQGG
jgi:hypothetical protein